MHRKFIVVVLALAMVMSVFGLSAFAQEKELYSMIVFTKGATN